MGIGIRPLAYVTVAAGVALLASFLAAGAPMRATWRDVVKRERAEHFLAVELAPDYKGAFPPLWSLENLDRLAGAPGVTALLWRSSNHTTIYAATGETSTFYFASPDYLVHKGLLSRDSARACDEARGCMLLSRERAVRLFGSTRDALGKDVAHEGIPYTVAAVYPGSGPDILVFGRSSHLITPPEGLSIETMLVQTKPPARRVLGRLKRWAGNHHALPEGYEFVAYEEKLRPDRVERKKRFLKELTYLGTLSVYAATALTAVAAGVALMLSLFARTKQHALMRVWGSSRARLVLYVVGGEALGLAAAAAAGATLGALVARSRGGHLDVFALQALFIATILIALVALLPAARFLASSEPYQLLSFAAQGLRAQGLVIFALVATSAITATLLVGYGVVATGRHKLAREISNLGVGIYTLVPDIATAGPPFARLWPRDLEAMKRQYPGMPFALLSNVQGATLVDGAGHRWKAKLRVTHGDFWGVVRQRLAVGDASGIVVTPKYRSLLGKRVRIELGPGVQSSSEAPVTGVVDPIQADGSNSPRLKDGWVWLDADRHGLRMRGYFAAAFYMPGKDRSVADAVAAALSRRYPEARSRVADPATGYAESYLNRLETASAAAKMRSLGLVVLGAAGIASIILLLSSAWPWLFALHAAMGCSRAGLLAQGAFRGALYTLIPVLGGAAVGMGALEFWGKETGVGVTVPWGVVVLGMLWAGVFGASIGVVRAAMVLSRSIAQTLFRVA